MKRQYTSYRPKYVNGRCRNEPIPMEPGELEAMGSAVRSRRRLDGMTKKERREAYVRERKAVQNAERDDGGAG